MSRWTSVGPVVIASAALVLAACGGTEGTGSTAMAGSGSDTGSAGSDTDGSLPVGTGGTTPYGSSTDWWMTSGGVSFDGGSAGVPGDDGEEEGKDEEGGKDEDFVGWFGEGTINPGTSYDGILEAIAFVEGEDQCVLIVGLANVAWLDTCAQCEFAFSYTLETVDSEVDAGCASHGFDPDALTGGTHSVGYAEGTLYWLEDGNWQEVGEAEYEPAKGFFGYTRATQ